MLEWRKIIIDGIETNYSVSNEGEVKNDKTNRKMTLGFHQGYRTVGLKVNGKNKGLRVHRLVANAFIPNPEKKPYVNHIDGNRGNNKLENLEWVTPSENTQHAVRIGLMVPSRERSVIQFGLDGKRIAEFKSISEACRITSSLNEKIVACCQRIRTQHNGYQWRYKEDCCENIQPIKEYQTKRKQVAQIDPKSGEIIAVYNSLSEAARAVQGTQSAITHVLKGDKQTKTHKGFGWKLVEDIVQ